jgi:hypothetical protein
MKDSGDGDELAMQQQQALASLLAMSTYQAVMHSNC